MAVEERRDVNVPSEPEPSQVLESSGAVPIEQAETSYARESPKNLGHVGMSAWLGDLQEQAEGVILELKEMAVEENVAVPMEPISETSNARESPRNLGQAGTPACYTASNILWSTGSFSDPIPNGFYYVIPRLKQFKSIPTLDELRALGDEGVEADVILVDFKKDKKINMLKQLITKLVEGLNPNPVKAIKKIAGLVVDVYKRPPLQSPKKTTQSFENRGFPLLGQIRPGSCRVRAILFKVLADTVGLESKLVVGLPRDLKSSPSVDSYDHMSVVVVLNTVEMMVDLTRCPGQLIPMSSKAICMSHISVTGSDFCHSPLGQKSPMYSYVDQIDNESLSRSEPNIATKLLRCSQGNGIRIQRTASSSPEGPYVRTRARFMLNGDHKPECSNDVSRSERDISESLKQSRFLKEGNGDDSSPNDLQTAISLQSSLQNNPSQSSEKSEPLHESISQIWNEVLRSPMFQDKPLLPNEEWNIDFSELELGTPVGIGCSGKVFRGIWNGKDVAIKMFLDQEVTVENIKEFCNEISIHSRLQHPNVIKFLGACTKSPQLSLVTEYMEKGSLYNMIHSTEKMKNLSWGIKLHILRDICRGLMGIHQMGIVHRDLKSANCLLNKEWTVKICDFGLSRKMEGTTMSESEPAGTPEYIAPEVIRKEPFSEKCDIFSFGVIMWELCTLSKPWEGVPKELVMYNVANEGARLDIPEGPLSKLIADCWSEPEHRPSCEEILTHLETCECSLC
ncbi:serine/threonine-protein kinase CTR1 [Eutrema salsugineum]|uniref:serine/threonine-protein kinase CTR1 n=1 Tax=Eutrema salsugineum TaxID=72664 RepID=UPI000CED45AC|nr:serine/threonine-protein kinase CTR1 [Eutrema salsugineum]